ncbi:MAG: pantoate--beta-alanine ligase [Nocardioides sp.]
MTSLPHLASSREALTDALAPARAAGGPVVLVPTMGALHAGHAALLAAARERAGDGTVVASVFVNPLQFGEGEDLDRYPRTLDADLEVCARAGVDLVFAPATDEMYPGGDPEITVDPGPLGDVLEGEVRPGHFRGVLTVVAKLFGLTGPDVACFGEKDYQQLVLIRRMSRDLCLGVEVVGVPTVREADGLALSSRNRYLGPADRARATILSRALDAAAERSSYGVPAARWAAQRVLDDDDELDVDYLAIRTPELEPVSDEHPAGPTEARILVAGRIGETRLIDNRAIVLGGVG